jgi:YVTN family beta-propeller protein
VIHDDLDAEPTMAADTGRAEGPGLAPGTSFAGHRIEAVAGTGGMGVVYRARNLVLDQERAIKVIAGDLSHDKGFQERFRRESRLAASIEHPNLVPIHHAGEERGRLYLAMRFIEGTDLRELIDGRGRLEPEHAVRILDQVAAALDAAHQGGLVHRDVKPANVLLEGEPGQERAYLTDFGISKLVGAAGALTTTGRFVGTVDYVAPEQIAGEDVDGRADVYSLACILFHALAGQPPFRRDTELATLFAHADAPRPRLTEFVADSPPELDQALARGMAQRPDDRFPSAGELAGAVHSALDVAGRAPTPHAPTRVPAPPPRVLPRPSRRRIVTALVAGGALAAVAAAVVLLLGEGGDQAPEPPRTEPQGPQPQPVATIEVGKEPQALTFGDGNVWVAGTRGRVLNVIDPADDRREARSIQIDGKPGAVAVGFGSVWVVDHPGGSVLRLAPDGDETQATIDVGENPSDIALDDRWVWVTNEGSDDVSRVDPRTNDVDATVDVGDAPHSVATWRGATWVTNFEGRSVSRIDARTAKRIGTPIEVGQRPNDLAVGEGYVWVTDVVNGTLYRIDPKSDRVVGDPVEVGSNPRGVKTGFGYVWVANGGDGTVARVDPESGRPVGKATRVGADPSDVAVGAGSVWTSNAGDSTATRVRPGVRSRAGR